MMADELMESSSAHDGAICTMVKNSNPEKPSPVALQATSLSSELNLPVLAVPYLMEFDNYRRSEPYIGLNGLEL